MLHIIIHDYTCFYLLAYHVLNCDITYNKVSDNVRKYKF